MPIKHLKSPRHNSGSDHKNKKNKKKRRLPMWLTLNNIVSFTVVCGLILAILFVGWVAWISRELPSTDGLLERNLVESTKIYDRTGEHILYQIHGDERRTAIEITDLPQHVPDAFIAIEDKDYYEHNGLIFKRLVKAIYDDGMYVLKRTFIPRPVRKALGIKLNKIQGASTITQQFIKNAVLTPEKKIARKVKEMILAWQLEKKFTKEQILKMYLNEISYGGVNYGIESAAQNYFKKPAKELTIAESAVLAALINSPTRLSPYGNYKDELIARQQFVLKLMFEQERITLEEYEQAKQQELAFNEIRTGTIEAPHFVMYVRQLLEEDFGAAESEALLKEGGLKVYTTLDFELQQLAEKAVEESQENLEANNASNAALVAMDPKTGEVLAMVGSVDYFDKENQGNFNAALGLRQPGSSIKPLIYTTAFQKGFYPESVLYDVVTDFDLGSGSYIPKNYDLKEHGAVTMRKALQGSLNIPAVKALYLVGVDEVSKIAGQLGYTTLQDKDRYGLSLVLGGAEVKLLEHVGAYAAFANDGVWNETQSILKIEDREGNVIKEYDEAESRRVIDAQAARMISDVLSDNEARAYAFGEQNILVVPNRQVAAKTGTTNDYRDGWTVGYTPALVTGVWAGNNDNSAMRRGAGGSKVAGPIWNQFMREALQKINDNQSFVSYPPNASDNPALNGQLAEGIKIRIDTVTGKRATENTPEELVEEKLFQDPHSILHYVNRLDPSSGIPENPAQDSQYENWEQAIQDWIVRYNQKAEEEGRELIEVSLPPEEYDDVHSPENIPSLSVMQPWSNTVVTEPFLDIEVSASALRGVADVQYFINGQLVGRSTLEPYVYRHEIKALYNGEHTLTIKACDDVQNCSSTDIPFTLELENALTPIHILSPENNSSFFGSSFPLTLSFDIRDSDKVSSANVYYRRLGETDVHFIRSLENIVPGFNSIKWDTAPSAGKYYLFVEVIDNLNNAARSQEIEVTIL